MTLVIKSIENSKKSKYYGYVSFDSDDKLTDYVEKPDIPTSNNIALCIYVFKIDFLNEALTVFNKNPKTYDIGREIIMKFIDKANFYVFKFPEPWYYLGDVQSYWEANMEVLKTHSLINLRDWNVCTNLDDRSMGIRPPAKLLSTALVEHSMISDGCCIEGTVINSILSPGVIVNRDAVIKDSVILHDCFIERDAQIQQAILDKDVRVMRDCRIGVGENLISKVYPEFFHSGITVIGRSVKIPSGCVIGKNCVIFPTGKNVDINTKILESGETIRNEGLKN